MEIPTSERSQLVLRTGVLHLKTVSPIIRTLFGPFHLRCDSSDTEHAYFTSCTQENSPYWHDLLPYLLQYSGRRTPSIDRTASQDPSSPEELVRFLLRSLAVQFDCALDPVIVTVLSETRRFDKIDFETLFKLACRFDDGHGLKTLQLRLAQMSSPSKVVQTFLYIGQDFSLTTSISEVSLGGDLDSSLRANDLDEAASRIVTEIQRLLNGIQNQTKRKSVHWRVADLLAAIYQDSNS
jgi:hypothetical protein